jgi:FkbH-like protein
MALIRTLARRGIISSICSRNDHDAVARILSDAGIWDYMVMPSVNWEAKGPRLQALIESFQLRSASALFIDDNHLNREEARHFLPDLQVSDPSIVPGITTLSQFAGKDDPDMTRLRQYKLLERRKADRQAVNGETVDFLRGCDIVVEIEHDIKQHLDRAIEPINRTNQLNFVKSRLPEDLEQARRELNTLLAGHDIQAGLVRVSDRYGDHGYCGIYMLKDSWRLLQFAFSCRIMGMGVERWLYQRKSAAWIAARGGCDIHAIFHYFNIGTFGSHGEFNFYRNGCDVRIDHSMFLRYAITGLPAGGIEACNRLGYQQEDFRTTLLNHRTGKSIWLLSFWSDAVFAIYRHRETGVTVPFMLPNWYDQARDVSMASVDNLVDDQNRGWLAASLDYLKHNFDYLGLISEELFKQNLKLILNSAPRHTRIVILGANEHLWDPQANIRHKSSQYESLNRWTRAVARWRRNVTILNVRDFVESDAEVHNWGHFDRMVYFRIYGEIERLFLR